MFLAPARVITDRLELRLFEPGDLDAFARMCADPEVMRYLGTGETITADLAWRSMAGFLGHWHLLGYGQWAVTRREDGALLGRAGFLDPHGWPGFELGYALAREHWGRGYAREACAAALRIAREDLKKDRIISLIRPANAPSIKLAMSLGAQLESTIELMGGEAQVYAYPAAG
jgi:RimJ/RimL family protein N-acetyltransferase